METEIIQANKDSRRKVLIIVFLSMIAGLLILVWGFPAFSEYIETRSPQKAIAIIKYTLIFLFLAVLPASIYVFTLGRRIYIEERFPPKGMKVIKDTPLLEGIKAKRRGLSIQILAAVMTVFGLGGAVYVYFAIPRIIRW